MPLWSTLVIASPTRLLHRLAPADMSSTENDISAGRVQDAKNLRPQKRLKTPADVQTQNSASASPCPTQLPRTKKKGNLANLLEMPLDVLYEVHIPFERVTSRAFSVRI